MKKMILKPIKKQQGMSLIEVLIAALILGTGLVSIAAMQINALKMSSNSLFRVYAIDAAKSLADRMRANNPAVIGADENIAGDNEYIFSWTANGDGCGAEPKRCAVKLNEPGVACDTAVGVIDEIAAWDLYEITCDAETGLNNILPVAELDVACNSVAGAFTVVDSCQISIKWEGSDGGGQQELILPILPGVPKGDAK